MKERVYAQVNDGTESMFRVMSLLRRKAFEIHQIELVKRQASHLSDLTITVEKSQDSNPYSVKLLIEQLDGIEFVVSETGSDFEYNLHRGAQ